MSQVSGHDGLGYEASSYCLRFLRLSSICDGGRDFLRYPQAENPLQAQRTGPLFLACHPPNRVKPHPQRLVGTFKNRSRRHRCLIAAKTADNKSSLRTPSRRGLTPGTPKSVRPAQLEKIRGTCFFRTKSCIKLAKRSWVVFHTPTYYILGLLESTEYPH